MDNKETLAQLHIEARLLVRLLDDTVTAGNVDAITLAVMRKKCVSIYERLLQMSPNSGTDGRINKPYERDETLIYNTLIIDEPTPNEIRPLVEEQINKSDVAEEEIIETPPAPIEQTELQPVTTLFTQQEIEATIERNRAEEEQKKEVPFTPEESNELSLHEKLSLSTEKRPGLAEKLQQKVESLKSAISLNKKIAFVNQLFGENTVEYAKAIDKLNQSNNLDEALRYYSELKVQYQWDTNNELVKDLEQLVIKRFS
jgi:hypothetical protein